MLTKFNSIKSCIITCIDACTAPINVRDIILNNGKVWRSCVHTFSRDRLGNCNFCGASWLTSWERSAGSTRSTLWPLWKHSTSKQFQLSADVELLSLRFSSTAFFSIAALCWATLNQNHWMPRGKTARIRAFWCMNWRSTSSGRDWRSLYPRLVRGTLSFVRSNDYIYNCLLW